jgi:HK97 gp10 family phage protein
MAKNSMTIGFELSNFQELRAMLRDLPPSVESRVMGDAVAVAAKPIIAAAKARAPSDTGALRRSITAVVKRYPKAGKIMAIIGPDKAFYGGGKRVKQGQSKKGKDRPSKYAHLVEFGHYSGTATGRKGGFAKGTSIRKGTAQATAFIRPRPFLRPAVAMATPAAVAALQGGVEKGMEREIKRTLSKLKRIRKTTT